MSFQKTRISFTVWNQLCAHPKCGCGTSRLSKENRAACQGGDRNPLSPRGFGVELRMGILEAEIWLAALQFSQRKHSRVNHVGEVTLRRKEKVM